MTMKYDLTVIGGGPGGYTAAISAARYGMEVALVETDEIGGTCLNRGCIPAKTLLYSANMYREVKTGESVGILNDNLSYDLSLMYRRKDEVVAGLRTGVESLLQANKIDIFHGMGKIPATGKVQVESGGKITEFDTDRILVATGSLPVRPPVEGIDLPGVVTSDELLKGPAVDYRRLIIIGGGVIGVEFASVFNALGCDVTIIEAMGRIVSTLDREISHNLSMILKKRGVVIHTECSVERISESEDGLCCHFSGKNGNQKIETQGVLVSTGRKPNTAGLFGEGLSVEMRRGIIVDRHFETSEKGIYAVGDVIEGGIQLAHAASAQAKNVAAEIAGEKPPVNLSSVPNCIFTSPEIASVGMTPEQAKTSGVEVKISKYSMLGHGKTIIEKQDRSFIKLVYEPRTEVLLGAQLMCARASDLAGELSLAIVNKLMVRQLSAIIRPHPTFSEAITEAAEDSYGHAIHIMPRR